MNYSELSQALQDYIQTDETTFVANIPVFTRQAEERIYRSVKIPDLMKEDASITMTSGNRLLSKPTDLINVQSISYGATDQTFLLKKDTSFIREAYPNASTTGSPVYYANYDDDYWILGPTPDDNYATVISYYYDPDSIVDAGTSWLGDNAESLLLHACLLEAYIFQKGDADMIEMYTQRYNDAMRNLMELGMVKNMRDDYREREQRVER